MKINTIILKNIKKIKFLSNLFFVSLGCSACCEVFSNQASEPRVYQSGYFEYSFCKEFSKFADQNDSSIAIVGLTELGCMQESLDIPKELDGYTVKKIGVLRDGPYRESFDAVFSGSENLKKLFVKENIEFANFELRNVDLMVCSSTIFDSIPNNMFLKNIYFDHYVFESNENICKSCGKKANISFLTNNPLSNGRDVYRIDNINVGDTIVEPIAPVNEKYTFNGWYTEPECVNSWNFSNVVNFETSDFIELYAGWSNK